MIDNNELIKWCDERQIKVANIRRIKQTGKTRIKFTLFCKECGSRFDTTKDTLYKKKYPGLCTKCAHKMAANKKRLIKKNMIEKIESYGLKVLTPIDKIYPKGKNNSYLKANIEVTGTTGERIVVSYNNLINRINYYCDILNNDYKTNLIKNESRLEFKVRQFLEKEQIPYKTQFRFMDCKNKRPLPFDFCLFYNTSNKIVIEVDGERHYDKRFKDVQKNDRIKDYYCRNNNIPLLRISYKEFINDKYQDKINQFISTNGIANH